MFGRIGSRPFNLEEMRRLFLKKDGTPWYVSNDVDDNSTGTGKSTSGSQAVSSPQTKKANDQPPVTRKR